MVQSFIQSVGRVNPFKDGRPGPDWILNFERRNDSLLTRRKPEILTMGRAKGLTKPLVEEFFNMYEDLLKESNLVDQPGRIFNLDETGLSTNRVHNKVYVSKGSRDAYLKSPVFGKANYTVLFCVSATVLDYWWT